MQTLVLSHLDDHLLAHLTELASANQVSIEEQAALLLKESSRQRDRNDRVAILKAIAAMTPKGVVQTDSLVFLREDRDR